MLEQLIVIVHILAAIAVVGLILLQQGKGAEMGASFGSGASQTVLGVQGSGNFLTHATAILTTIFFITSLSLAYYAKLKTTVNTDDVIIEQTLEHSSSASDEVPVTGNSATMNGVTVDSSAEDVPVAGQVTAAGAEIPVAETVVPEEPAAAAPQPLPATDAAVPAAPEIPE